MKNNPAPGKTQFRLPLAELERRCQKPDYREVGTWMARRIVRPAALRITWYLAPWGVSANMVTCLAWVVSFGAAWAFGFGNAWGWTLGVLLLQCWYLLDHVDGQIARLREASSLDGVQLDYLMHHSVNLVIPFGIGWGMFRQEGPTAWLVAGFMWGWGLLLIGLQNDARYKAFIHRLSLFQDRVQWIVENPFASGWDRLHAPRSARDVLHGLSWLARKACEIHVVMNMLTVLAGLAWLVPLWGPARWVLIGYVGGMSVLAPGVALGTLWRSQRLHKCEKEFAGWFSLREKCNLPVEPGGFGTRELL